MNVTHGLLTTGPVDQTFSSPHRFYDLIESCFETASSCWISADACLNERDFVHLKEYINKCLTCAEVCAATARALVVLSEEESLEQLKVCLEACEACCKESRFHSDNHEHCLICCQCCQQCIRICESYIQELQAA